MKLLVTKTTKYFFIIILQLILSYNCVAQIKVIGYVYDKTDNTPLTNAIVCEQGTENRVATNRSGKFKIKVKDSLAKIKVTYPTHQDTLVNVKNYKGEKIFLKEIEGIVDLFWANRTTIGYFGDFNRFPYGFYFYHYRPYFFNMSGRVAFKTDFNSNYDLKLSLSKINLFKFKHSLSLQDEFNGTFSFQKRKYDDLEINDYRIVVFPPIRILSPRIGFALKDDINREEINKGIILGLGKGIKWMISIHSNITFYENFIEYNIGISKYFSSKKKFWDNLKLGIGYQKYRDYNEYNIHLSYHR